MRSQALQALCECDPREKCRAVAALDAQMPVVPDVVLTCASGLPGRPLFPQLVAPGAVPRRGIDTPEGHAALIHALAHIEFNAINLALDAVWRFAGMPEQYYRDWLGVAREEARHFSLLQARLGALGYGYGDFAAHDGLWEMAQKTAGDVLARMALVPRTLEARGLDAAPRIREKLLAIGDEEGAAILSIILRDEIGHVAVGNRWYGWLCAQRGVEPLGTFRDLCRRHKAPGAPAPLNRDARLAAGFTAEELDAMQPGR